MREQAKRVLAYLKRYGSDTDSNIGLALGIPAPSVRRSIQELANEGIWVSFAGHTGLYQLAQFKCNQKEAA